MNKITQLHADIEIRVKAIRDEQPEWLCREGCDGCCQRLAEIPTLTKNEWDLLQEGLTKLPPEQLVEIDQEIAKLVGQSSRPVICPLLDRKQGICRVYDYRPVACRTYGFYSQRNYGLYCKAIETQVAEGRLTEVVWGNHEVIERRLGELGERHELPELFARWKKSGAD